MNYIQILNELEKVDLKEIFVCEYEKLEKKTLLKRIKETDKINSTATLLRRFIKLIPKNHSFWIDVLHYFNTPDFARKKNFNKQ